MDSVQQQQLSQAFTGIDIGGSARVHLGNAYHINQAAPNRPETPPNPLSTVPFPRDPDFVDRSAIFGQVKEKLVVPAARVALVGLGGVGKSQLAIEWSYRKRDESPNTWVLWIHASSTARFEQGVRNILDQLKVSGRSDSEADVFHLLRKWLHDAKQGSWLVILDNADDASFLLEPPTTPGQVGDTGSRERRLDYIPTCSHGSLLVTSRSRAAALRIVEHDDIIDVGPMEEEHALALLEKKLGGSNEQAEIARLAQELEHMPLAITQASAYISHRSPRCSVRQYMDNLANNEESKLGLLNRDDGNLRRDREARNSIILTWEISFEHIRTTRRSAADLLSLMSFYDRQAIPAKLLSVRSLDRKELIRRDTQTGLGNRILQKKNDRASLRISAIRRSTAKFLSQIISRHRQSTSVNSPRSRFLDTQEVEPRLDTKDEDFEEDLKILRDYSFVSITAEDDVFEMHRLVQLATQRWLKVNDSFEHWGLQFMGNLDDALPSGEFEHWNECQSLFPHALRALETTIEGEDAMLRQASVLKTCGIYARKQGAYIAAVKMATRSVQIRRQVCGGADERTIASSVMLASVYQDLGRYAEAEALQVKGLEWSKRVLGNEHPQTVVIMVNLANTYDKLKRYQEAEALELEVLKLRRRTLGDEHPATVRIRNNLSGTYLSLGRHREAEELLAGVSEWSDRILGCEHPDTIALKNSLAILYGSMGRHKEAEELTSEMLKLTKRVLGDEHPETINYMANLALCNKDLGRKDIALDLMIQAARLSSSVLGDNHPDCIECHKWVAELTEMNDKDVEVNDDKPDGRVSTDKDGTVVLGEVVVH